MREWLVDRELFLAEFLRFEGRGNFKHNCHTCDSDTEDIFRCKDCDGASLYCSKCLLHSHSQNALHRIEVFTSLYDQSITLDIDLLLIRSGTDMVISPRQHSSRLDIAFSSAILLGSHVALPFHHSIRISLSSTLTEFIPSLWISVGATYPRHIAFSCCALVGTQQPLDFLAQQPHTACSSHIKCCPLSQKHPHLNTTSHW